MGLLHMESNATKASQWDAFRSINLKAQTELAEYIETFIELKWALIAAKLTLKLVVLFYSPSSTGRVDLH